MPKQSFDLSVYFVVGPSDTNGRPVRAVVAAALRGGATFVQLRSKLSDAAELINMAREIACEIAAQNKEQEVAFVIDDRADVVYACRALGIKVDGVHVGQSDVPVAICRQLLGADAIIGLSASIAELADAKNTVVAGSLPDGLVDYIGAGPVHASITKPNCGELDGVVHVQGVEGIARIAQASQYPVVAGGGVTVVDVPALARSGAAGFFVVSAIAAANDPEAATHQLATAWYTHRSFLA